MPVSPDERPPTPPASKPELVELNRSRMTLRSRSRTEEIRSPVESAQRTAVKQRPHQETERRQVATSEPVVHHHGREGCAWQAQQKGRGKTNPGPGMQGKIGRA